jgi:hypothetical protein
MSNGKGDKRRPELVVGSYRKNYVKVYSDSEKRIKELAKKYDVDLSKVMVKR